MLILTFQPLDWIYHCWSALNRFSLDVFQIMLNFSCWWIRSTFILRINKGFEFFSVYFYLLYWHLIERQRSDLMTLKNGSHCLIDPIDRLTLRPCFSYQKSWLLLISVLIQIWSIVDYVIINCLSLNASKRRCGCCSMLHMSSCGAKMWSHMINISTNGVFSDPTLIPLCFQNSSISIIRLIEFLLRLPIFYKSSEI